MRRDARLATGAAMIALATLALNGCGADDSASTATSSSSGIGANEAAQQRAPSSAALPAPMPDASAPLAANPAAAAASDPITQNMQASLAADSQQVAPVMHYAPGDSAGTH